MELISYSLSSIDHRVSGGDGRLPGKSREDVGVKVKSPKSNDFGLFVIGFYFN